MGRMRRELYRYLLELFRFPSVPARLHDTVPVSYRSSMEDVAVTRGTLVRFRVMAVTTAVLLIVLVFLGVPLQIFAGNRSVVNVVGTLHGFLYLLYVVAAFNLTRKIAIPKWQMFLVLLAGTVPFCAFVAERKMTRRYNVVTCGTSSRRVRVRFARARNSSANSGDGGSADVPSSSTSKSRSSLQGVLLRDGGKRLGHSREMG